jgi:CRP-like cAMP-binding protein
MNGSSRIENSKTEMVKKLLSFERENRNSEEIDLLFNEFRSLDYFKSIYSKNILGELIIKSIIKCMSIKEYKSNEIIYKCNDIGSSVYVILKGCVDIYQPPSRNEHIESNSPETNKARLSAIKILKSSKELSPKKKDTIFSHTLYEGTIFGDEEIGNNKKRQNTTKSKYVSLIGEISKIDLTNIFENTKRIENSHEIKFYNSIEIFSNCKKGFISKMQSVIHKRIYKKGDVIIKQDDPFNAIYLIRKGSCEITYKNRKSYFCEYDMNYFLKLNGDKERFSGSRMFELKGFYDQVDELKVIIFNKNVFKYTADCYRNWRIFRRFRIKI